MAVSYLHSQVDQEKLCEQVRTELVSTLEVLSDTDAPKQLKRDLSSFLLSEQGQQS